MCTNDCTAQNKGEEGGCTKSGRALRAEVRTAEVKLDARWRTPWSQVASVQPLGLAKIFTDSLRVVEILISHGVL